MDGDAVNADDPRAWGAEPEPGLEAWLCRGDLPAVDALCRWLVDGEATEPPLADSDAPRAVTVAANG
jgi:hypothetical protein